ncbi:uncharacterized protein TNCV_3755261 [Trichonephila clavipes]|nr:uncharacterized protein TNCV_3755261 [Trichonephila clavipes]
MPLRRFRRQYEQLTHFETGRILSMMEVGGSNSDESRFNLSSDVNRVRVWRPLGVCLNPAFALQRHTTPTASVMIWGVIAYNTWSTQVLIRCTMRAQCVFPARISSQISCHSWRSPLPHASALIQRDFGCVLGVQQTKQLRHVAEVDLVWQLVCNQGQSLSNHGPHVFYRRKIRKASQPEKQFNLGIEEEPLDKECHVWSGIILLKYGCGQALKVRKDNWLQHLGGDVALYV